MTMSIQGSSYSYVPYPDLSQPEFFHGGRASSILANRVGLNSVPKPAMGMDMTPANPAPISPKHFFSAPDFDVFMTSA